MRLDTLELGICLKYIISSRSISFNRHTVTQCPEEYIPVVLNKMGFVKIYAQAIIFGPSAHGGIGAIDLTIKQGIMIIYEVMRTIRTPGHGQELSRISLGTFQHVSGLSLPLLKTRNKEHHILKDITTFIFVISLLNMVAS